MKSKKIKAVGYGLVVGGEMISVALIYKDAIAKKQTIKPYLNVQIRKVKIEEV